MTVTLTEPIPAPPHDDEPVHLVCCDKDISMCGLDVTGEAEWPDAPDSVICKLCAIVEENGWACPVPGCPGGQDA